MQETKGFPGGASVKHLSANRGDKRDAGLIPGSGRSPEGGYGNPLQYSCPENPMDGGAWQVTAHRVRRSQTQLKRLSTHTQKKNNKKYQIQMQETEVTTCQQRKASLTAEDLTKPGKTVQRMDRQRAQAHTESHKGALHPAPTTSPPGLSPVCL